MKHPMLLLLLLLAASTCIAADPDDDTLPAAGKPAPETAAQHAAADAIGPAQAPASTQDPLQARADAIHAAQGQPAAKPAVPALPVDPMRGGYPESAHKAFAARHAIETRTPDDTSVPYSQRQSVRLSQAEDMAYATCLNNWFADPAHLPKDIPNDAAHHDLCLIISQVRTAHQQHCWPCWVMKDPSDGGKCAPLIKLGNLVGNYCGPDWLADLCGTRKHVVHHTN